MVLDGDTAVVGGPEEGRVYVFERTNADAGQGTATDTHEETERDQSRGPWTVQSKVPAPGIDGDDVAEGDQFGQSVALGSDVAVVGAPNAGSRFDRRGGRAYVLRREDWRVERILMSDTLQDGAAFGAALSVSGDTVLVGSPALSDVGRAYLFDL